jgi:hypothetical protein
MAKDKQFIPAEFVCPACDGIVEYGERFCGRCGSGLNWANQQLSPFNPYWYEMNREMLHPSRKGGISAVLIAMLVLVLAAGGWFLADKGIFNKSALFSVDSLNAQTLPNSSTPPSPGASQVLPLSQPSISSSSGNTMNSSPFR